MRSVNILSCPNCGKELCHNDKSYYCLNNHHFDIAKEGYVNLLVHTQKPTGDNKEMVMARREFFKGDHYKILKDEILKIVKELAPEIIVDAGAGEGYYTKAISDHCDALIYAFDMSKNAIKIAKKKAPKVHYIVANVFHLPLISESVDLLLSVFTPLAMKENHRILKKGAYLLKVGPASDHLFEMKALVYDAPYLNPIKEIDHEGFEKLRDYEIKEVITLSNDDLKNLFMMTPYVHSCPSSGKERLFKTDELKVTIAFRLELFKKL